MANLLILAPAPVAAVTTSRGEDALNLLSDDPREVWADSADGSPVTIDVDLGAARAIDTVFLGHLLAPLSTAAWSISGGVAGHAEFTIMASSALRVPDVGGMVGAPRLSHALWHGAPVTARYLRLSVTQPAEGEPLTAGVLLVGRAFVPVFNHEWGGGRRPIDTGSVTALSDGGFSVVEGVRKSSWFWTLGDLSDSEKEALFEITIYRGEGKPVLVVEDPAHTAGLRRRIHYGLFRQLKPFERTGVGRTRWELSVEDWGAEEASAL